MNWDKLKTYINALPSHVNFNPNTNNVELTGSASGSDNANPPLSLEPWDFQNMLSKATKVSPTEDFISYLRSTLLSVGEASDILGSDNATTSQSNTATGNPLTPTSFQNIWSEVTKVSPTNELISYLKSLIRVEQASDLLKSLHAAVLGLSTSNGLKIQVDIQDSLIKLLQKLIETSSESASDGHSVDGLENAGIQWHGLTIKVQIPITEIPYLKNKLEWELRDWAGANHDSVSVEIHTMPQGNLTETLFEGKVSDAQAMIALAIVLKSYPKPWRQQFFWDAWLAITVQLSLGKKIFPLVWPGQVFDAERLAVNPEDVKCLLFGIDPVSKSSNTCDPNKATGIAFHAVGNNSPSIRGMKTRYGLNCDTNEPETHCRNGLLMVNLIRCIGRGDDALNKNTCRSAWIPYTLKIIDYFTRENRKVIMLTEYSTALPAIYIPAVCHGQNLIQGPHPAKPMGNDIRRQYTPIFHKVKSELHKHGYIDDEDIDEDIARLTI